VNDYARNPVIRLFAVIVAIAAGIRLIFWLLAPVMPYLVVILFGLAASRLVRWYRNRW
jgi:hypothetical protein